jgi:hypothetical protein
VEERKHVGPTKVYRTRVLWSSYPNGIEKLHPTLGAANQAAIAVREDGYDCQIEEITVAKLGKKELYAALFNRDESFIAESKVVRHKPGMKKAQKARYKAAKKGKPQKPTPVHITLNMRDGSEKYFDGEVVGEGGVDAFLAKSIELHSPEDVSSVLIVVTNPHVKKASPTETSPTDAAAAQSVLNKAPAPTDEERKAQQVTGSQGA